MDVKNCKGCGRLFNYLSGPPLCPGCMKGLDDKFIAVKEYIYSHPGAGIQEVSEEMEVSTQQIKNWIREERLSFAENSAVGIECEACGKSIKTGRYCTECKGQMINSFGNMYHKPVVEKKKETKESPKMRFLDN